MKVKELIKELLDQNMEAELWFNDKHNTEYKINEVASDISRERVWIEEGEE